MPVNQFKKVKVRELHHLRPSCQIKLTSRDIAAIRLTMAFNQTHSFNRSETYPDKNNTNISTPDVRPVQNRAGFKANEMHPPDTHSRRQPVLQSANPRASKLQQYQPEILASSNSNPRNRQSSNRRYTNNDFQKAQVQTVYDPESETYITKPIVTNSQSGRHQHADNHYQRNQQQQHLLQQQQQHQQQQQQQYMRQQQMVMQETYNQEQKQNMNVGGHRASPVNEGRQNIDPYYQNQQHLGNAFLIHFS